jgi:NADPH:quinone reductase-like Zn-dependent oxidoreductase
LKAVVQNGYGSTKYLTIKDVKKPSVKDNEVLVKVLAASVNAGDLFTVKGNPFMLRFEVGFPKPKDHILGWDVAGIVESVGKKVKRFKKGDEVYGSTKYAFAEFAAGEDIFFERKPKSFSFEEAAAIPTAALTALQRLRDGGKISKGQKVLILGASGGVGSMAVQIARSFGCEVHGVCSSSKKEMVRSLGAIRIYSYDKEDFTRSDQRYDLILDNTGRNGFSDMRRVLKKNGLILPNSGHGGMGYVTKAFAKAPFDKHIGIMKIADLKKGDLKVINRMIEKGLLKPHVDRTFSLKDTAEAMEYMDSGRVRGKVAIRI